MLIRQYELLIFPNPTITQNIPDLHTYLHAGNLLTVAGWLVNVEYFDRNKTVVCLSYDTIINIKKCISKL